MVKRMNFSEEYKNKVKEIDEILIRHLPEKNGYQKVIMEAMENHRVKMGLEDGGEVFQYGLLELEQRLPADRFLRCHKSYLVNMDHVKRMEKTSFIMADGRRIPIGRTYQKTCREAVFGHVTKAEQDRT